MNYLIDEEAMKTKGANTEVSLLHHFLEHHGLGESFFPSIPTTVWDKIKTTQ